MNNKNTERAANAAKKIIDGRMKQPAEVMVTLQHTIATVLLSLYDDPRTCSLMMNEGLVQGVEQTLCLAYSETSTLEVLKIQRPLSPRDGNLLVYNKNHTICLEAPQSKEVMALFKDELKIFVNGFIDKNNNLHIHEKIEAKGW